MIQIVEIQKNALASQGMIDSLNKRIDLVSDSNSRQRYYLDFLDTFGNITMGTAYFLVVSCLLAFFDLLLFGKGMFFTIAAVFSLCTAFLFLCESAIYILVCDVSKKELQKNTDMLKQCEQELQDHKAFLLQWKEELQDHKAFLLQWKEDVDKMAS